MKSMDKLSSIINRMAAHGAWSLVPLINGHLYTTCKHLLNVQAECPSHISLLQSLLDTP